MASKSRNLNLRNHIVTFRRRKLMTQSELASQLGVSVATISGWERRLFSVSSYYALLLCQVFECRFEDLFYLEA